LDESGLVVFNGLVIELALGELAIAALGFGEGQSWVKVDPGSMVGRQSVDVHAPYFVYLFM
jgi:hypothetical protein